MVRHSYWVAPEDLRQNWARLRDPFQREAVKNSGRMMSISILAENGDVTAVIEATFKDIEPRRSQQPDIAELTGDAWWQVIRRLRSVAPNFGRGLLHIDVFLDGKGNPVRWTRPELRPLVGSRER